MIDQEARLSRSIAPLISVVIPSYNSTIHIRDCLQAIFAQNTELPFEVVLVDSSNDGTDMIVADEFPQVRLFHFEERRAPGTARNIGSEKARGDVILFLDTDCIADSTWINQMYTAIQGSGADGVGGSVRNGTPWSISGCAGFYLEFFRFLAYDGEPYATPFLIACSCGFRKDVFENERYSADWISEDFIFSWRLTNQGKKLLFLPSVSVKHMNKTGLINVLRYQYKLGIGAYSYRYHTSPKIVRFLKRLPILVFFMPPGIMAWIGNTILGRLGLLEFLKFTVLLPLLFIANNVWAMGFYHELTKRKYRPLGESI